VPKGGRVGSAVGFHTLGSGAAHSKDFFRGNKGSSSRSGSVVKRVTNGRRVQQQSRAAGVGGVGGKGGGDGSKKGMPEVNGDKAAGGVCCFCQRTTFSCATLR